ncbi:MAG: endonuclease/exonuclease/phosphatase family protein [Ignavibacteria bacterium]|jgi:exonuclease III|nr:endonuclease/exonuclease/phosphatase family protein [Ignavibacteria bacterium]MCU7502646.1 endonuclease/exonuclease/phosphatase family protein [Ignavibacteria bacterium]MCU7515151.1 endonuclease/exonuclease/phosphatase family protein [Ignavibacteria bacterium]
MSIKLVELNIRHGGGNRISKILKRITEYNADVIVLTEFRHNKNYDIIRNKLHEEGFEWQAAAIENSRANTVFIASKLQFTIYFLIDLPVECTGRSILVRFEQFSLMGVYFAQKKEKKLLSDFIMNNITPALGSRGLIIGDFNTGRHYIDEPGKTFYCADSFVSLEDSGLIDSWRKRISIRGRFFYRQSAPSVLNKCVIIHALKEFLRTPYSPQTETSNVEPAAGAFLRHPSLKSLGILAFF